MAKITPEAFTATLETVLGSRLSSVVLYGSAAAGDYMGEPSDYNLLVVLNELGLAELKALAKPTQSWVAAGNPPPLVFTFKRLQESTDVFPIELLDIRQSHKVLFGPDCIADLDISRSNLRLQVEHELKGKLIKLREAYLMTGGKPREVAALLVNSLSTFQVLIRAALRLMSESVPARKHEATDALARHLKFDPAPFHTIEQVKQKQLVVKQLDIDELFANYLKQIEIIVDTVNDL